MHRPSSALLSPSTASPAAPRCRAPLAGSRRHSAPSIAGRRIATRRFHGPILRHVFGLRDVAAPRYAGRPRATRATASSRSPLAAQRRFFLPASRHSGAARAYLFSRDALHWPNHRQISSRVRAVQSCPTVARAFLGYAFHWPHSRRAFQRGEPPRGQPMPGSPRRSLPIHWLFPQRLFPLSHCPARLSTEFLPRARSRTPGSCTGRSFGTFLCCATLREAILRAATSPMEPTPARGEPRAARSGVLRFSTGRSSALFPPTQPLASSGNATLREPRLRVVGLRRQIHWPRPRRHLPNAWRGRPRNPARAHPSRRVPLAAFCGTFPARAPHGKATRLFPARATSPCSTGRSRRHTFGVLHGKPSRARATHRFASPSAPILCELTLGAAFHWLLQQHVFRPDPSLALASTRTVLHWPPLRHDLVAFRANASRALSWSGGANHWPFLRHHHISAAHAASTRCYALRRLPRGASRHTFQPVRRGAARSCATRRHARRPFPLAVSSAIFGLGRPCLPWAGHGAFRHWPLLRHHFSRAHAGQPRPWPSDASHWPRSGTGAP